MEFQYPEPSSRSNSSSAKDPAWLILQKKSLSYREYDPFRIPPNIALSLKHFKCTQFGTNDFSVSPCSCCHETQKIPLNLCSDLAEIETVSRPHAYYFNFILGLTIVCCVSFCLNGTISISQLYKYCSRGQRDCIYVYGIPFQKFEDYFTTPHEVIDIVTVGIMNILLFLMTLRYYQLHVSESSKHKASNYSILLGGVDHTKVTPEAILSFFRNQGVSSVEILYTHKVGSYIRAQRTACEVKSRLEHLKKTKGVPRFVLEDHEHKLRTLQGEMQPIANKFYFGQEKDLRTDKVFISFNQKQVKNAFEDKFRTDLWARILIVFGVRKAKLVIADCPLSLQSIAQPTQIIWENLEVTDRSRYLRILASNFATILILMLSFGLTVLFSYLELKTQDDVYLSYLCGFSVSLVNLLLSFVLEFLSNRQGRYTTTWKVANLMAKECAALFLNTAMIPFSMFFVFGVKRNPEDLIRNVLIVFLINNFISPLFLLMNFEAIYKLIRRSRIFTKQGQTLTTQYDANSIFEKPDFVLEFKYAIAIKLVLTAAFYGSIFPLGNLFTVFGLILLFWICKYMLLSQSCIGKVSYGLGKRANKIAYLIPFVYSLGIVTNQYMGQKSVSMLNMLIFVASGLIAATAQAYFSKLAKMVLTWRKEPGSFMLTSHRCDLPFLLDYKHVNPTSCGETKHRELNYRESFSSFSSKGSDKNNNKYVRGLSAFAVDPKYS